MITEDPPSFESRRLVVEPVTRLWLDPGFVEVAGHGRAVEAVGLATESATPPIPSPAFLLRADVHVVRFRSRVEELSRLAAWCHGPGFGVRLMTGPGGQGKTRLARELGLRLAMAPGEGWVVKWWEAGDSVAALDGLNRPTLLVVDYAETRPNMVQELVLAALSESVHAPIRLLLLARSAGDWWRRLSEDSARLEMALYGALIEELTPLEDGIAGREAAFAEALTDLSAALTRMGLDHTQPDDVSWPDLRAERFARSGAALTLQMEALARLLDGQQGAGPPAEEVILTHERRYWRQSAKEHRVDLSDRSLQRAVAAAALCGADAEPEALTLLAQVRGLRDQSEDGRIRTALWLRDLYPPTHTGVSRSPVQPLEGAFWGSLQPDRLAEYLISGVVAELPSFLVDLLKATSSEQDYRALTVLSRASVTDSSIGEMFPGLLAEIPALATTAVRVAPQSENPRPLAEALTGLIGSDQLTLEQLATVAESVPHRTRGLAEFAAVLERRLTALYEQKTGEDPDAYLPALATSLNNLSVRLAEVGRREEGLAAIQRAVEIRERLAEANPDAYLPALATSLNNLSAQLGEIGRRQESLAAIQRAVEIRERLAEANPDAYLPDLATSLNNLSIRLGEIGRLQEGLAAIQRAVETYERLTQVNPDAYLPDLATSLNNLSIRLAEVGRRQEGLAAIQRAVEIRERLAEANPDAYLPDLATSWNNLSIWLAEVGRGQEGLAAIQRAIDAYEQLAEANPDAYLPALATSWNNLSGLLSEVGRGQEGLAAIQRAVEIRERLAEANPDAYLPDLAISLNKLSVDLDEMERREEGLAAIQRAVEICERLAEANPDVYLPHLADSLSNLSMRLGEAGRREEGLAAIQRAVEICERLAEANPDAYLPDLAKSSLVHGLMLIEAAITDGAIWLILRGLSIAVEMEFADLVNVGASALQNAYRQEPSQTAEAWRRVTSTDPPDWMTQ
ncbi:tetratricopeptide repeat protein [Microtetraspora fusca]|uniref:Tetratricopeptide repeat protein n=1 Tax=Microtetraspora fusca TaxID=1997 RepID=A0ABW6VIC3_MICFU